MLKKRTIIILINSKMLHIAAVIMLMLVIWGLYQEPAIWTNLPLASTISGKRIVIDAGHGGIDPGASPGMGLLEKDLNLDIALRLKRHFSMVGVYCIMIRETDRDFSDSNRDFNTKKRRDLSYRTRIANRSGADVYLAIHANSHPQAGCRGAQTFYEKNDPKSKRLAESIQRHLKFGVNRRRAKTGDYRVLNDTGMPGVMIEVGFLSNPYEVEQLKDRIYREKIAKAIFKGVIDYFSNRNRCVPMFRGKR